MAFRYLELEYVRLSERRGLPCHTPRGVAVGAALHFRVSGDWRARLRARAESLTPSDLGTLAAPLARPDLPRRGKACRFLAEVALVSWVERMNACGVAVSTRAVLERRGLALAADAATSHGRRSKLSKGAKRWVSRWQKRHG